MAALPKNATLFKPEDESKARGIIQIIHGMSEHQKRYIPLAEFLAGNNFYVITSDLRGHGSNVNGEQEYGYFGDNGMTNLISDVHDITLFVKSTYSDLPYFLLGHSMGSLIAVCYFKRYDNFLSGLFLSGLPCYNPATKAGKVLVRSRATFKGDFYRSNFINNMVNGPFEKKFADEGSAFAWLSKDRENVREYEKDDLCGFVFTLNGFYTLMELLEEAHVRGSFIKKNRSCPVMLMSGSDDPCMIDHKNFMSAVNMFKEAGYKNTGYILYPGCRHEIFNDIDKEKVMDDLLMSMNAIIDQKRSASESNIK